MFKNIINYINETNLKIIMTDNNLNISNYQSILIFDDTNIIIDCLSFILTIKGLNLSIKKLYNNEILVTGVIKVMEFNYV